MKTKILLLCIVFACSAALVSAATNQWVHVNVQDRFKDEKVKINIPLSLVETLLPLIEEKGFRDGRVHLNDHDFKVSDLRKVWKELRSQGDTEFFSVESRETNIRMFIQGNYLMVKPQDHSRKNIDIQIPLVVMDAMLSGDDEELDLVAAVQALKKSGVREIISIQDEDKNVRVWIDETNRGK
jgi:hypothetical protein